MNTLLLIFQLALLLGFPLIIGWLSKKSGIGSILSPIVLAYLIGIIWRNALQLPVDDAMVQSTTEISILIAIPLLLFSTRWSSVKLLGRSALLSFGLCVLSGLISTTIFAWAFRHAIPESWTLAGMLVGIYTGGTPNMQAIGLALQADQDIIILANAADIIVGGVLLILLTSVFHTFLGTILPNFPKEDDKNLDLQSTKPTLTITQSIRVLGISLAVVAVTIGITFLVYESLDQTAFIMLILTTLSLIVAAIPAIRKWPSPFGLGEYFLLVFSIGLGLQADLQSIWAQGTTIIAFTACCMYGTIIFHLIAARICKIDRDTFMITATAALYGPAFIGPISSTIGNRSLLLVGMATGLLGYAIGNYLGLGMAWVLSLWLG
ncbi:MAG: DUF819 family protein [Saprospiraceae bacterium]|nr:DUF819 family protein [Saprospiraceae bacterium]